MLKTRHEATYTTKSGKTLTLAVGDVLMQNHAMLGTVEAIADDGTLTLRTEPQDWLRATCLYRYSVDQVVKEIDGLPEAKDAWYVPRYHDRRVQWGEAAYVLMHRSENEVRAYRSLSARIKDEYEFRGSPAQIQQLLDAGIMTLVDAPADRT